MADVKSSLIVIPCSVQSLGEGVGGGKEQEKERFVKGQGRLMHITAGENFSYRYTYVIIMTLCSNL